jgi:site-specific DNA-methyltransferase (adenine-specific)
MLASKITENTLFYGDNLPILRDYIPTESVDLIYLDPPFNSNRSYNVLFREESGREAEAQITAFEDTWHWNQAAEQTYHDLVTMAPEQIGRMVSAMREFIGPNQMMAYLVMMAARLVELHRVLKPTGSLYLHCDPTASHYLRVVLDAIFGPENCRNEITWKRADAHNDAKKQFGMISDRILLYAKSKSAVFNRQHGGFQERTLRDWYQYLELPDGTVRRMTKEERQTQKIPAGARRFNTSDLRSPNPRPNLMYEYKGYKPHRNGWAMTHEKMADLDARGLLIFPSSPEGRIMRKRYLDEQPGAVVGDVWSDISQIRGQDAELLGYPTQKPLEAVS